MGACSNSGGVQSSAPAVHCGLSLQLPRGLEAAFWRDDATLA
jgi:hypothetical protein